VQDNDFGARKKAVVMIVAAVVGAIVAAGVIYFARSGGSKLSAVERPESVALAESVVEAKMCYCAQGMYCVGPRGGQYCITDRGKKQYLPR